MTSVITNLTPGSVNVSISSGTGCSAISVPAGASLLLGAKCEPRDGITVTCTSTLPLIRILAHLDHARDQFRAPVAPAVLLIALPRPMQREAELEAWFIGQLARDGGGRSGGGTEALAGQLAREDDYGLLRFLLQRGSDLSIAELARRYGLSPAQFNRRCRRALGGTLKSKLRVQRAAKALLEYPGAGRSFTRLAVDNGYASLSHFCTEVKEITGFPPLAMYRAMTNHSG